jgi:c-di-GMP-binding flagellar brake protein YcgR
MFVKGNLRNDIRIPHISPVRYSISVLNSNDVNRVAYNAVSVDISAGGLGMLTDYPLEKGYVLTFEDEVKSNGINAKSAIVRWAGKIDGNKYRVGLKFIKNNKA